MTDTVKNTV